MGSVSRGRPISSAAKQFQRRIKSNGLVTKGEVADAMFEFARLADESFVDRAGLARYLENWDRYKRQRFWGPLYTLAVWVKNLGQPKPAGRRIGSREGPAVEASQAEAPAEA